MINAGQFNRKIKIYKEEQIKDNQGFITTTEIIVLEPYANVKTTKGFTLIANNSDFEEAYTNFTIRYPKTKIDRKMKIKFNNKIYSIEYLNNINEENSLLEIQAKEITH